MSSLIYLSDLFFNILVILIFARVILSWIPGLSYGNPIVQLITGIVDPLLAPFRKLFPPFGGIDFSPLIAIVLITVVRSLVHNLLSGLLYNFSVTYTLAATIIDLFSQIVLVLIIVVGVRVLIVALQGDPWHPASRFMRNLSDPLVRPFRSFAKSAEVGAVIALVGYIVLYIVINEGGNALLTHIH